ncbi:polycystin-1-like [Brachionichthys hirsutus]|uniref:polycystin-1-like n=1 Tax=Brachionichthys hirsutus TaxID=412623 RepID=UPI0036050CBC
MMAQESQDHKLWILYAVLISVAGEDIRCPKGGQIHLGSWRCYWLSEKTSSWPEAEDLCRETPGGELASSDSEELQSFIHYSFPVKNTAWVWLKGSKDGGGSEPVGEPVRPEWGAESHEGLGVCPQMELGTLGRWRKAHCAGRHIFLCEKEVSESLPTLEFYLTGLALLTGVYAQTQIHPSPKIPDIGQLRVEMLLFPGMWFSHAGQLVSVELVVQPSAVSSLARVQILRPYCSPDHHLIPPGCSSLINPFSCCSAVPLCNTTGGCRLGQYWCPLLEACVHNSSPCSPYDSAAAGRGFALPPRYKAVPPFYHLVADLPLSINPGSELETISLLLPDRAITVFPDDIVALQHTRKSGTFLHCLTGDAVINSPWQQSYLSLMGAEWGGWWEGGLTFVPQDGQWVDEVVCDLKMLYMDNQRGTAYDGNFGFTPQETTTPPDSLPLTNDPAGLQTTSGLDVIHPMPDEKNQIHVQINVATLIVIRVLSGQKARSFWSGPVRQREVPFFPFCPDEVTQSWPGCERDSHEYWFSSVTLVMPSVGSEMLNISVTDAVRFQSTILRVFGYEAVTELRVEPHGCPRMLVETPQSFTAKVERGSSVKFTWAIDNLDKFYHEGESYTIVFKRPAEYKLKSQQILLTAAEMTPITEPDFLLVRNVVAIDAAHLYTIKVKVDISLPLTFRWDFGDGSSQVVHTQSAPCQAMEWLMEAEEKRIYVQDSVNYMYSIPDDYTLHVQVSNQYNNTGSSIKIRVRPELHHLRVSSSPPTPLVNHTLLLEAFTEPSNYVIHTWDFGDGSEVIRDTLGKVGHAFESAGTYNITVCANNTLTVLTTWIMVEVIEKISGITVHCSGPVELHSAAVFSAAVTTGNNLVWNFDFGDGCLQENLTDGSITHIYKSPGNYTVDVTAWNSASQAHQSISVEVYRLTVSAVLPTGCVMSGRDVELTALVNGNVSTLDFHWLLGDGSPLTLARGQATAMHKFKSHGTFHLSLTVFSSPTYVSFNTSICVETAIINLTVRASQEVVAVGDEVCLSAIVSPRHMTGYELEWISSCSSFTTRTENRPKCFVFKNEGIEEVSVTASNNVSSQTARVRISIQTPVSKLSVGYGSQSDTLMLNTLATFWVASCVGSNVTVLWDFGDGSPVEQNQNVSHIFTSAGQFTVTATAANAISRGSVPLKVNVLSPVSDLLLHTNQPYSAVGEETLISASSSAISNTTYYWTADGAASTKQGTAQFRFTFLNPGIHQVRVVAQTFAGKKEAAVLIEVFERLEGLQIESQSVTNMKYVPTQEELRFVASLVKGSNATYHWLAIKSGTNQQITGEGEIFSLLAEIPGGISVHLTASNKLGETTSRASLVAVQRVTSANITTQSNTVELGRAVNISVSVIAGTDLHYFWYVKADLSPLQTNEPFLRHTFTSLGHCLVRVSVQNVLGHSNVTKDFNVQEKVQGVDFQIEGKTHPFYIATGDVVPLHGIISKGSDLKWFWKISGIEAKPFKVTEQNMIYSFPYAGIYQVSLNVSNGLNWQMVSHSVAVQDAIRDLTLTISKHSLCTGEQVSFSPTISSGSNGSFVIVFRNKDWVYSQALLDGHFSTANLLTGTHLVTLKAWNQVSTAEISSTVVVSEKIQGLQLVNCCSAALEALKEVKFKAEIRNGLPVNYTWIIHAGEFEPTRLLGQEVVYVPPRSGQLSVSVTATNGVCSETQNGSVTVEWPVKRVKLVCHSERTFVGHAVMFSAQVNGGSNLGLFWDFGDSTEVLMTDLSTISHTYNFPGKYRLMVKVLNSVSHVSTQLYLDVEELQCSSPQAFLIQSPSTIFRSRPSFFETNIDNNCSAYKTVYLWEILKEPSCTNANSRFLANKVSLRSQVDVASPYLLIPKHSLDIGRYCLVFTVFLRGTPLLVQQKTTFTVVHSQLVAFIRGGSHRTWPSFTNLILDGSASHDPDMDPGTEDALQYHWALTTPVTMCEATLLPVTVECVSCATLSSPHAVSYGAPIVLAGQCEHCDSNAQYKWGAEDQDGIGLDLNGAPISTGSNSPRLIVRPGVLQAGQSHTFTLNVSRHDGKQWGSASLAIRPISRPHGGVCDLSAQSDTHLLNSVVTYNCSGWQDGEDGTSQLIYTLQVAPCHAVGVTCPLLTLYRGARSTFGSLVPLGSPGQDRNMTVITIILLVENHPEAKVVALNRTLPVKSPVRDEVTRLREKTQTELWTLVQHGNPQEIVPYSIALISHLNQMELEQTAEELKDRREIRKKVTEALVSLPVSSMVDVEQISSALLQSTAVPRELLCEHCQDKVLETVGKMIHVMEEQLSPGALLAVETGRNILNIIGSILAAVSETLSASRSHPASSITTQSDSTTAVSALGHTGALVRCLIRAHVPSEVPLSLSTPYINTVGFHGDPSNLLCTHQSNQNHQASSAGESERSHPCHFLIPASLTSRLKSQRSEVLQVLFDMDADLGGHPLLMAADPPISTALVAMELTTPQGEPIHIQNLDHEQAVEVNLPIKHPVGLDDESGDGLSGSSTCLTVTLPSDGRLNFTVKPVDGLDKEAGLYISFNFSLDSGAPPKSLGHVKIEVSSAAPQANASTDSLVREWALSLSARNTSTMDAIFLSPLSLCRYFSVKEARWSSEGLQPLEGSTLHGARCLTRHLTLFGASMFVHPGAVLLLPPSAGPVRNMVVAIVCAVFALIHLLLGLIACKLDHLDGLRLSQVPLCGRPGLYHYRVLVKTGRRQGAGTTAHVGMSLYGVNKSGSRHLQRDGAFQRGNLDQFHVETAGNLGEIWKIRIWHNNTGLDPSWYVQHVVVWDQQTDHMFFFLLEDWLSVENPKNGTVEKEVLASCPDELCQFRRVFASQLMFGLVEHHLWVSLWERPAHSRFTRGQRVMCSALTLNLYLALGALWYGAIGMEGQSGAVSAWMLVNLETVAVGMTLAALVFPLQCFLCFLFRKANSQVAVDVPAPPPVCHSVEMDVCVGQSERSGNHSLSLSDSSSSVRDSPSSRLESKAIDSSILDFWAASGLAPHADVACQEEGVRVWPSCDSLINLSGGQCLINAAPVPNSCKSGPAPGPVRQLRRKKALLQLCLASPSSTGSPSALLSPCRMQAASKNASSRHQNRVRQDHKGHKHNLTTILTLSEEDLLMSIAAAKEDAPDTTSGNSDSGRDSPKASSSISSSRSTSCSSWTEQSDEKSLEELRSRSQPDEARLSKCPSVLSVDSVASTFLPCPSFDSSRSSSATRIGVARSQPGRQLPPWTVRVIYPLAAMLLGACLTVVGLYGSFLPRAAVLMLLISSLSAFLTSTLLLEPLKVFVQALICTALWRPVDPEVDDQLAQDATVVRTFGEQGKNVRPPCGYGLLQAVVEARKVRALRSLMRHCVCQLLFVLLLLMVNYHDSVEQSQGRLLHSAVKQRLHTAPMGVQNLTSLRDWSDAEQWLSRVLVPHLHQSPTLGLVGLPRLRYTQTVHPETSIFLGDGAAATHQRLTDLHMADWSKQQFQTISIDFTHYHGESALFLCVSVQLRWVQTERVTPFLSMLPLHIPSSFPGLDLQVALTILLFISVLLIVFGELWSMATERSQYLGQFRHWFQLLLAFLTLATVILQICFLSQAAACVSMVRKKNNTGLMLGCTLAGNLQLSSQVGRFRSSAAESLEGAGGPDCDAAAAAAALHSPWKHVEGFLSLRQTGVSVMSMLSGRTALRRLCMVHPYLGPFYGLLLTGGCVWLLARLCGAVLIHAYRAEQTELHRPATEPQDYEMVKFFIKRLKLWMGLTKAKEFRHRVKFEGMDIPPSWSSQESFLSTFPSHSSAVSSPRPLSSTLSVKSEDSSESGFDVQPSLDRLLPCVTALLSHFDQVNQIIEGIYTLEIKLEEAQTRRKERRLSNKDKDATSLGEPTKPKEREGEERESKDVRNRKTNLLYPKPRVSLPSSFTVTPTTLYCSPTSICIAPRSRRPHSESESAPFLRQASSHNNACVKLVSGIHGLNPTGSPAGGRFPRRRAWHSGSSHSADAAQRISLTQGGLAASGNASESIAFVNTRPMSVEGVRRHVSGGVPVKRKAWIAEGSETEQD